MDKHRLTVQVFVQPPNYLTNPEGRYFTLSFSVEGEDPLELGFDRRLLLHSDGRHYFARSVESRVEDWMLGLPGDISQIERDWNRLAQQALTKSGIFETSRI